MTQNHQSFTPSVQLASRSWMRTINSRRTTVLTGRGPLAMSMICRTGIPLHLTVRQVALAALFILVALAGFTSNGMWSPGLGVSVAQAATGVTSNTGAIPATAGTIFGSWDQILSLNIIPLGALAVGVAAIFAGIRGGSGGLIGGGVVAILIAILTAGLPAIVTESTAGAGFDFTLVQTASALRFPIMPLFPISYGIVRYVRSFR